MCKALGLIPGREGRRGCSSVTRRLFREEGTSLLLLSRGKLYSINQPPTETPGTWINNKKNFEAIQEGGTQGHRPAEIYFV
jgi:hypothetical protein